MRSFITFFLFGKVWFVLFSLFIRIIVGSSFWSDVSRFLIDLCVNVVLLNWLMNDMFLMVMVNFERVIFGRVVFVVLVM